MKKTFCLIFIAMLCVTAWSQARYKHKPRVRTQTRSNFVNQKISLQDEDEIYLDTTEVGNDYLNFSDSELITPTNIPFPLTNESEQRLDTPQNSLACHSSVLKSMGPRNQFFSVILGKDFPKHRLNKSNHRPSINKTNIETKYLQIMGYTAFGLGGGCFVGAFLAINFGVTALIFVFFIVGFLMLVVGCILFFVIIPIYGE